MRVNPRLLYRRVLFQALDDLVTPKSLNGDYKPAERERDVYRNDAKEFFFGDSRFKDLDAICHVAGISTDAIIKRAGYVLDNQIDVAAEFHRGEMLRALAALEPEQEQ